jgi:hypothetical protein
MWKTIDESGGCVTESDMKINTLQSVNVNLNLEDYLETFMQLVSSTSS